MRTITLLIMLIIISIPAADQDSAQAWGIVLQAMHEN